MKSFLQILGTGSGDSSPSLLLFFDNHRYLFNVGENTQRLCVTTKTRLHQINHIFLTNTRWQNTGGLPGVLLTLADAKPPKDVNITGPPNLHHLLHTTRHFVNRPLEVNTLELKNRSHVSSLINHDDMLHIRPILLSAKNPQKETSPAKLKRYSLPESTPPFEELESKTPVHFTQTEHGISTRVEMSKRWLGKLAGYAEDTFTTACYICHVPDIPGKFDPKKAKELGLRPGPIYRELQRGNSVLSDDKSRTIHPHEVIGEATPGAVFIVLDIPTMEHLNSLCKDESWAAYTGEGKYAKQVTYVMHLTPQHVLASPQYRDWMNLNFGKTKTHVVINSQVCSQNYIFESAMANHLALHDLDPLIFPRPHSSYDVKSLDFDENWVVGQNLSKMSLYPYTHIDRSEELLYGKTFFEMKAEERRKQHLTPEAIKAIIDHNQRDPSTLQLTFLGTGSASPSKYRNVSSIYVQLPLGGLLMDAGEGSYGQLYRNFGERTDQILSQLKMIWISHMHADHLLGTLELIIKHRQVYEKGTMEEPYAPLIVVGPGKLGLWLSEYDQMDRIYWSYVHSDALSNPVNLVQPVLESVLGIKKMFNVRVPHTGDSRGLIIEHMSGWKLVYSGDTRPTKTLEEAGKDATVLVHEATFEDGRMADALQKKHSTASEAVQVGKNMRAKHIVLTHFSQRYPRLPILNAEDKGRVSVAFDLMTLDLKDMGFAPCLNDALRVIFMEDEVEAGDTQEPKYSPWKPKESTGPGKKRKNEGGENLEKKRKEEFL
ncbi:zinc phosphodiesterase ELAC protein 2 isoform 1 [Planoprotostelium fungivorum]|uniref:ribonuclease Z n=1 Tax=Planoprotostelium fungivorum TaxID=1890364 RepID=A0A2P6NT02_9EUKA|nr:zinc phosphodiesterase ELAC protein 2 isoform 1 [Planoprotostelium fungivorum]